MKKCCRCKEKKHLEEFYKNRSKKDGRVDYCRPCMSILDKEKYIKRQDWVKKYYQDHKKEIKKYKAKWYQKKKKTYETS